jgi:hypothetical protein
MHYLYIVISSLRACCFDLNLSQKSRVISKKLRAPSSQTKLHVLYCSTNIIANATILFIRVVL